MIVYFSGTGNSRHVAQELAMLTADKAIPLLGVEKIDYKVLGVVCPVYSWGISPVILNSIKGWTVAEQPSYVWVALTCGDDTGMAPSMISKALVKKGLQPDAIWSVQMPNTYVLLPGFDVDSQEVEQQKINNLPVRLKEIAGVINRRQRGVNDVVKGTMARLKTGLVYPLFVLFGIQPRRFRVSDACVGCGRCAELCPMGNIIMKQEDIKGKKIPVWGKNCTSCLGCYHGCVHGAIAYGTVTRHKGRYQRWQ